MTDSNFSNWLVFIKDTKYKIINNYKINMESHILLLVFTSHWPCCVRMWTRMMWVT